MLIVIVEPDMAGYGYLAMVPEWEPGAPIAHGWTRENALDDYIMLTREGYFETEVRQGDHR